jgi:hypothetical protein
MDQDFTFARYRAGAAVKGNIYPPALAFGSQQRNTRSRSLGAWRTGGGGGNAFAHKTAPRSPPTFSTIFKSAEFSALLVSISRIKG